MAGTGGVTNPRRILDASEQIAREITRLIVARNLEPGDRIGTESVLVAELGVSRPTLREAIRLLSSSHLVRAAKGPGGGIFVANTPAIGMGRSVTHTISLLFETHGLPVEEMLEARRAIEVSIAGLAAQKRDPAALQVMREALELQAATDDLQGTMRETDRLFHLTLAGATQNRLLQAFIEWAYEVLQPQMIASTDNLIHFDRLLEQHLAILAAVEAADTPGAEAAMRRHLDYIAAR